jgi:hypothetical protein
MARKVATQAGKRRLAGVVLAATAVVAASGVVASPASASPPRSGAGASNIIQYFTNGSGTRIPFRTGNNRFGEQHIRIGGSTANTENHELTGYAKTQWASAMSKASIIGRFPGSQVYSHKYATPGGRQRTMCVAVDTNDFLFAGGNYGYKGIITAFWINGHHSTATCNSSPG